MVFERAIYLQQADLPVQMSAPMPAPHARCRTCSSPGVGCEVKIYCLQFEEKVAWACMFLSARAAHQIEVGVMIALVSVNA